MGFVPNVPSPVNYAKAIRPTGIGYLGGVADIVDELPFHQLSQGPTLHRYLAAPTVTITMAREPPFS